MFIEQQKIGQTARRAFYDVVRPNMILLLKNHSESLAFNYVCERTLRFGKFTFTTEFLFTTYEKFKIPPASVIGSESFFRKLLTKLSNMGFLSYEYIEKHKKRWIINLPQILRAIDSIYAKQFPELQGADNESIEQLTGFFVNNNWRMPAIMIEGVAMKAMDALKKGKEKAAQGRERKINRLRKKKAEKITPNDVIYFMSELCKQEDIKFFQPSLTGKEKGCIKNFIEYCNRDGIDIHKHLEKICFHWEQFATGVLKNDYGQEITLPPVVDFMDYFKNRRQIDKYLSIVGDRPEIQEVQFNITHISL